MIEINYSSQFKKDCKKVKALPDLKMIFDVISKLEAGSSLEEKYKDHRLSGNWIGYRDCHIKPDLVLIYKRDANKLELARLGSHSELF